ncbi:MAG: UDP-glucose/GDP-mannose dehydrogenase family protein [marine benthic group bacterium]|nr:UDP-glucose/GDP-mannose dehydrogenase family protein [Gemmatimonadota bacterium]
MNVTVIGSGYVGLVVGACLAETGNGVVCADVDVEKVASLNAGQIPIYEPGLDRLVARNLSEGRLRFTADVGAAARHGQVIFIAVGTPPGEDGSADLQHVLDVAGTIGRNISAGTIVITKSTVPVGTARKVRDEIERHTDAPFHVCSNPEFLKEGAAIDDFMRPDRIVCGVESEEARGALQELYDPFVRSGNPLIFMDIASAELTKYAANAMLATRISFMNQLAQLCEATGADVNRVRKGMGSDPRIGRSFLYAGAGYGGSCFPKDVRALIHTGDEFEVDLTILRQVHEANEAQKALLGSKARKRFGDDLSGMRFAVWGLAFKPETDDMREAPALALIEEILAAGGSVVAHDPVAQDVARGLHLGDRVEFAADEYTACESADALFVVTEWLQYRRPDWLRIRETMRNPIVFDGRNLFEPWRMRKLGYEYYPIGREQVR